MLNDLAVKGYCVIDGFWPSAPAARQRYEAHFGEPQSHGERHEVWNYWYVPDHYTYLRTHAPKVLGNELVSDFVGHLLRFARSDIAPRAMVTPPWLSAYVSGCGQELHNDARNGAYGYVLSLTAWDRRKGIGGETVLWKRGTEARSFAGSEPMGSLSFYDLVPAHFNRLLVFDDRMPHAVTRVQGSVDPLDARLVLHGHIQA